MILYALLLSVVYSNASVYLDQAKKLMSLQQYDDALFNYDKAIGILFFISFYISLYLSYYLFYLYYLLYCFFRQYMTTYL